MHFFYRCLSCKTQYLNINWVFCCVCLCAACAPTLQETVPTESPDAEGPENIRPQWHVLTCPNKSFPPLSCNTCTIWRGPYILSKNRRFRTLLFINHSLSRYRKMWKVTNIPRTKIFTFTFISSLLKTSALNISLLCKKWSDLWGLQRGKQWKEIKHLQEIFLLSHGV